MAKGHGGVTPLNGSDGGHTKSSESRCERGEDRGTPYDTGSSTNLNSIISVEIRKHYYLFLALILSIFLDLFNSDFLNFPRFFPDFFLIISVFVQFSLDFFQFFCIFVNLCERQFVNLINM